MSVGLERGVTQLTRAGRRGEWEGGRGANSCRHRRRRRQRHPRHPIGAVAQPGQRASSSPVSLGNLQLKAAASHSTMYPGNKRKKLWREEKGTDLLHLKSARGSSGERSVAGASPAPPLRLWFPFARRAGKRCRRLLSPERRCLPLASAVLPWQDSRAPPLACIASPPDLAGASFSPLEEVSLPSPDPESTFSGGVGGWWDGAFSAQPSQQPGQGTPREGQGQLRVILKGPGLSLPLRCFDLGEGSWVSHT